MTECDCNNKNISIRHEKKIYLNCLKKIRPPFKILLNSDQSTRIEIYIYTKKLILIKKKKTFFKFDLNKTIVLL